MNINKKIVVGMLCCAAAALPVDSTAAGWMDAIVNTINPAQKMEYPSIKVLLTHDQESVVLEIKGTYNIYDPRTGQLMSSRFKGKRRNLQATRQGIVWGEEFPGVHMLAIVPDNYNTKTNVDGIDYFGSMYVYDVGGTISIVNQVLVEDYLDSLMSPMFRNEMPQELLSALAITARTNAYFHANNSKTPYWDVDAAVVGYKGALSTMSGSPVNQAIQHTQFMVLNQNGVNNWQQTPFSVQWGAFNIGKIPTDQPVYSQISIQEAENMANKGARANAILAKAFPDTTIEIVQPKPAETAAR